MDLGDVGAPIDLIQPKVSFTSTGSYHVEVKDILKSQKGRKLIKQMADLNLVKRTANDETGKNR